MNGEASTLLKGRTVRKSDQQVKFVSVTKRFIMSDSHTL